ncbi:MAG: HNH endonuclease [Firmicutes bacterium]|nr:HNH endonuclease [Bacillota bacterium]
MPYRAKKPCAYPGCPKLTDKRYCTEHEMLESQRYEKYHRDPDHGKNYDAAWEKIRARFLERNPLCEMCREGGKLIPAVLVHHKKSLRDGGTNDYGNLVALCQGCHSRLHSKKGDRWGKEIK